MLEVRGTRMLIALSVALALLGTAIAAHAGPVKQPVRMRRLRARVCGAGDAAGARATSHTAPLRRIRNSFGPGIFGLAVGGGVQMESRQTVASQLGAYHEAGARWLRIDINWASIQAAGPTSYAWASTDSVIRRARLCGMQVLGVFDYTPAWARPAGTGPTYGPNASELGRFAYAAARHYRRLGVSAFEIWNEPNLGVSWAPAADPAWYAEVLKSVYPAIKSANPRATVVTGGLAPTLPGAGNIDPLSFLEGIYAGGGGGSFDAVGAHPYCWPAFPGARDAWSGWYQMYGTKPSLRSVMVAHGDGAKRIWGTEFGAPTAGPAGSYVTETTQAAMVAKAYRLWSTYRWAGPLFVFSGVDLGSDTSTDENHFGILTDSLTAKPAFDAYRGLSRPLAVAVARRRHHLTQISGNAQLR